MNKTSKIQIVSGVKFEPAFKTPEEKAEFREDFIKSMKKELAKLPTHVRFHWPMP